jgi:hypothetical protein
MPRIIIERGSKLRFANLPVEIYIDGKKHARLKPGSRMEFILPQGAHALMLKIGRKLGKALHFKCGDRDTLRFKCIETGFWRTDVILQCLDHSRSVDRFAFDLQASTNGSPSTN